MSTFTDTRCLAQNKARAEARWGKETQVKRLGRRGRRRASQRGAAGANGPPSSPDGPTRGGLDTVYCFHAPSAPWPRKRGAARRRCRWRPSKSWGSARKRGE